jgi:hypothetical protein
MIANASDVLDRFLGTPGGKALLEQAEAQDAADRRVRRQAALAEIARLQAEEAAVMARRRSAEQEARVTLEAARHSVTVAEQRLARVSAEATGDQMRFSTAIDVQNSLLRGLTPDIVGDYLAELSERASSVLKEEDSEVGPSSTRYDLYGVPLILFVGPE